MWSIVSLSATYRDLLVSVELCACPLICRIGFCSGLHLCYLLARVYQIFL